MKVIKVRQKVHTPTEKSQSVIGSCKSPDPLYGYGEFPGYWSLGCRLEAKGNVICSIYNPDGSSVNNCDHFDGAGRVWEISRRNP